MKKTLESKLYLNKKTVYNLSKEESTRAKGGTMITVNCQSDITTCPPTATMDCPTVL